MTKFWTEVAKTVLYRKVLSTMTEYLDHQEPCEITASAITTNILIQIEPFITRLQAEAREAALKEAADIHFAKADIHMHGALWIGPQRQRYEGARITGIEMSPMNGPAIAYDAAIADAQRIIALIPKSKEAEGE